jgi:MFS family permease
MASARASRMDEPGIARIEGVPGAVIAGNLVGNLSLYILPMLGGSICRRFQITDDLFGFVVSAQLAGMGISPILLASLPALRDRAFRILPLGLALIVLGVGVSAASITLVQLMILRALAGLGEGMILAVTYRVLASAGFAPRRFSVIQIVNGICLIGVYFAVPPIVNRVGTQGIFLAMAALTLALAPGVLRLSRIDEPRQTPREAGGRRATFTLPALAFLAGWAAFQVSQNGLWAYVERIGAKAGFTLEDVALAAIVGAVAYTAAPFLTLLVGKKLGWIVPLTIGCALTGLCCVALPNATTLWLYISEFSVFCFAMNLAMPYANAFAAEADPSGGLVTAMPGSFAIGSVMGPAVSGITFKLFASYQAVGWVTGLIIVPSAALMIYAAVSATKAS